jgi:uncharacterized protein YukE
MATIDPPAKPGANATAEQLAKYKVEYRSYRQAVEQIAQEIESLCKEVHALCEELGNSPMKVMDAVSTSIWSGRAAMEFFFEGSQEKTAVANASDELREMLLSVMRSTNSKLSSL